MLASARLFPKFVQEHAAMYYELRKPGTSATGTCLSIADPDRPSPCNPSLTAGFWRRNGTHAPMEPVARAPDLSYRFPDLSLFAAPVRRDSCGQPGSAHRRG